MRISQTGVVIAAGLIVSSLGAAAVLALLVFDGWPTYGPFILFIYGLPFVLLGVWARRRLARPGTSWPARNVALWSLPVMALGFGVWFGLTGVTSTATYPMTWAYGEPSRDVLDERHVVLQFVDFPNHRVGFFSNELAAYLESLPTQTVPVEFEITRDFGRVRGAHPVRIGLLVRWRSGRGYSGYSGSNDPAPW
jgi:hypothetical protein